MSNSIVKKEELKLKDYIGKETVQKFIKEVLGTKSTGFATNLTQVVSQNEMLKNADSPSVLNAAITATLLDLNLNPSFGHAYIVPFNNKQKDGSYKVMAQFILGYKGLKQLAIRSGQFKALDTKTVFEGQYVEDDSFLGFKFDWKSKKSNTVVGYACRFELINGFEKTFFMTVEQIREHAEKYSKTYSHKYGQWSVNFDGMASKTVTKLCLNSGEAPLSIEMQKAINADQGVINDSKTENIEYPDNPEAEDVPLEEVIEEKKEAMKENKASKGGQAKIQMP